MKPVRPILFSFFVMMAAAMPLAHAELTQAQLDNLTSEDFVMQAMIGNRFEVESSQMALSSASDPEVIDFARDMIDDHGQVAADMQAALRDSEVPPPPLPVVEMNVRKKIEKLIQANNFEQAYVMEQKRAHEDAVRLFEAYAARGEDPTLRNFAEEKLPALETHLDRVNDFASISQ